MAIPVISPLLLTVTTLVSFEVYFKLELSFSLLESNNSASRDTLSVLNMLNSESTSIYVSSWLTVTITSALDALYLSVPA